jgi:hypothetical protein
MPTTITHFKSNANGMADSNDAANNIIESHFN